MSRIGVLAFGLCSVLLGCSGDDTANAQSRRFPEDQTCGLRVELTGDITASATGSETETECLTTFGDSAQGFSVTFHPVQSNMPVFHLVVPTAREGVSRNDLPAMVSLGNETMGWFASGCMVDVEQRFIDAAGGAGDIYSITGNGSCTSAADSIPSGSSVRIGPFEFVTVIIWAG